TPEESYREQIKRDPSPLRIAVSHEWGGYQASLEIVAELEKTAEFLQELGNGVEWVTPKIDLQAAYDGQTAAYIMKYAQTIESLLEENGLQEPPHDLIEPICIRVWEAGRIASYAETAEMHKMVNRISRQTGEIFEEWDIILTPTMAKPTTLIGTKKYLTLS